MVKAVLLTFNEHDRRIFWISAIFFICSLALYVYFLGISVFAVIERKGAEQRAAKLSASIMSLESRYVSLSGRIDLTLAKERGFQEVDAPTYIDARKTDGGLSVRDTDR